MKKLFLIGAGGHCVSCIDVIEQTKQFTIEGLFDQVKSADDQFMGYKILGSDEEIVKYVSKDHYFLITVGQIKSPETRIKIFQKLQSLGANLVTVVSPRAYVARTAQLGAGTIVLHDALINANAIVGSNCIINSKSLVEHDAHISSHCHISTAAIVNGAARVEEGSFIGSNSVIRERGLVKSNSVISAGVFIRETYE